MNTATIGTVRALLLGVALAASGPVAAAMQAAPSPAGQASEPQDATAENARPQPARDGRTREQDSHEPPVIDAAEVEVRLMRVDNERAQDLAEMLLRQSRRVFYVRSTDGSLSGPFTNVDSFGGDVIMLHDRRELLPQLQAALAQATAVSARPARAEVALAALEYRPRYAAVATLLTALEPFARRIPNVLAVAEGAANGGPTFVSNVTVLNQAGVLVLRDTPEHLSEMTALLSRLDTPAPQVMITCLLIQERSSEGGDGGSPSVPEDLVRDLRELLPVTALERVGQAALRIAVVPGSDVVVTGTIDTGAEFKLKLLPAGYDREHGTLSMTHCAFSLDGSSLFDTSAVLSAGEYTVLGASGLEPLFVVLRVVPLEH